MASAETLPRPAVPAVVGDGMVRLRGSLARWLWLDGVQRVVWTALGLCAADFVLDWLFHMEWSQRAVLSALIVAFIAWRWWRRVARPLAARVTDDALCWEVESRNPRLGERLVAALSFARDGFPRDASPRMAQATIDEADAELRSVDFSSVIDSSTLARNRWLLALGVLGFFGVGTAVASQPLARAWFDRNILLRNVDWPVETLLEIEGVVDGRLRVPRGEEFVLAVNVVPESRRLPDRVMVDFSDARPPLSMKKESERRFELNLPNVIERFELRVRGGDAVSRWIPVELVEPPAIERLAIEVRPPAYTGLPAETLAEGKGPWQVLPGSVVRLSARANKPLETARLMVEGKPLAAKLDGPLDVTAEFNVSEVGLSAAGETSRGFAFELVDADGYSSSKSGGFTLRLRRDREPRVRARLSGIGGMVTPRARLPISGRATDDFGIAAIRFPYSWRGDDPNAAPGKGDAEPPGMETAVGKADVAIETTLDLAPLSIPVGCGMTLGVAASDNDDVSGPNVGVSQEFALRVVTDEELRVDLLRREKEQRQDFERLTKLQDDLTTDLEGLAADAGAPAAPLAAEKRERLLQLSRRHRVVAGGVSTVLQRLSNLRSEIGNNLLENPDGPMQTRLRTKILEPLGSLLEKQLPSAAEGVDAIRRLADGDGGRAAAFDDAIARERAALESMRAILAEMAQSETFQEAVNLIYELQKAQEEVLERTRREREQRVRDLLDRTKSDPAGRTEPESPSKTPAPADESQ
jgi:hypothetical protein